MKRGPPIKLKVAAKSKGKRSSWSWGRISVVLFSIGVAFLAAGMLLVHAHDEVPEMSHEIAVFALTKRIPDLAQRYIVGKKDDKTFPHGFNSPAIFKNTDVTQWLALKALPSQKFWEQQLGPVSKAHLSRSGLFSFYKQDRPLSKLLWTPEVERTAPTTRAMEVEELFRLWRSDSPNDRFVSFSEVFENLPLRDAKEGLWPLIHPFESLVVNDTRADDPIEFVEPNRVIFRLWMASGGSRTWAHHDWSHNFYVVLKGVKKVVLYPPRNVTQLRLFPYLHPQATKLQPDVLSRKSVESFPGFPLEQALEVDVSAGEVLYVPPYWFHDVTTVEPAMSIAIWSPSRDDGLSEKLLLMGLPVPKKVPLRQQLRVLFLWLGTLLDKAFQHQSAAHFVRAHLLDSRYGALRAQLPIDARWIEEHCPAPESPVGRYARASTVIDGQALKIGLDLVQRLSADSREIVLGNYVEIALHEFISSTPAQITSALQCLSIFLAGPSS